MTHSRAVQRLAERLNSAPEVEMVPTPPEPPQPPRTPAQQARDQEWDHRLRDVEAVVRNLVGPIASSGRSGSKAWVVPFSVRHYAEALTAVRRAGYECDGSPSIARFRVDLASLDRDLDRLRSVATCPPPRIQPSSSRGASTQMSDEPSIYAKAIDVLHERGWVQGTLGNNEGVCAVGALRVACHGQLCSCTHHANDGAGAVARTALDNVVGLDVQYWNDEVDRSFEDVVLLLKYADADADDTWRELYGPDPK